MCLFPDRQTDDKMKPFLPDSKYAGPHPNTS